MGWEDVAEGLYTRPPDDFTADRDRAAKSAPRGEAARIRALRRPTIAAWVTNLLTRHDRDQIQAFLGLGEQLRRAHRELDGDQLRELTRQQRRVVSMLSEQARKLAEQAGRPVGENVLREVEATLHAALADPDAARQVASGRLTTSLTPPSGFGPVGESATVHPLRPSKDRKEKKDRERSGRAKSAGDSRAGDRDDREEAARRARQQARAEAEAAELERTAEEAEREAEAAELELAETVDRRRAAEARVDELTERLQRAKEELPDAGKAERSARTRAQQAGHEAERRRDRAREAAERVKSLDGGSEPPRRRGRSR
ncbi:hypothetical protein [Wenjunlia tyrosinilytica]|uniref:Uncharacterized protein n=1 Tax=Wenjunlia tyrosinilytica TaxID=1544741 RepID=A0A917ZVF9_9ACTN|nr:hypothetical protein [Wenjunlia tyrosinilytica]GGO94075.1 hypothetical protein GCM10012280_48070 [Wenjunlia tyrosinilytica]